MSGDWEGRRCPCNTGLKYEECCGRYHAGAMAPTAETLMRSRFTAFVVRDAEYLMRTWDPDTRPYELTLVDLPVQFYRLDILDVFEGGPFDTEGMVEFEAFYRGDPPGSQRERSIFSRIDGAWFYTAGDMD
ncbi:YchJ family metal-binding protein [Corynebacterium sp. YIM 101645]|uniref:YchJ family metal-binding protein n=1 Tax=Corynebacterium lemuris TaxID=1859292 RepID=A0ABT2FW09_9CORY|nr:YchJ family metal-binding protein [Corynebacterium lemuris]MCS5479423.1 YchJ family metal-binding protein [Corynebacterium lemuris]